MKRLALLVSVLTLLSFAIVAKLSPGSWKWAAKAEAGEGDSYVYLPQLVGNPFLNIPVELITIPAGEFQMGCDFQVDECLGGEELPLHTVFLDEYAIYKYEVTNAQYAAFMNAGPGNNCGEHDCLDVESEGAHIRLQNQMYVVDPGYENHPIVGVSWYGAHAYCSQNEQRLPTEAEWEKAARGDNDTRRYPWGNSDADCTKTNMRRDDLTTFCVGETMPVGSYPTGVSPYGVMDMAGNAHEWVNDWYSGSYYNESPYANPQGPEGGLYKIAKGGSWWFHSPYVRIPSRYELPAGATHYDRGFRCVADVD